MSGAPTRGDWLRVLSLALIWGTTFAFIKLGLTDTTPAILTMVRLWIGALVLLAWSFAHGQRLPRLAPRPDVRWLWLLALGVASAAYPFTAIAIGQTQVPSALAGILMATVPLMTAAMSLVFVRSEPMSARKAAGLVVGLSGVVILVGPSALGDIGGAAVWAQLLVISAAVGYAASGIIAFRQPEIAPFPAAAGMMLAGAILATPLGVWDLVHAPAFGWRALIAAAATGVGGSGMAIILYLQVVRSAGPNFTVLTNYMVPAVAVALGAALGEQLEPRVFLAFAVILAGVWLASRRGAPARSRELDQSA